MKCPFRTIKKIRHIIYATKRTENDYDEETEFAECLQDECPYYGKTVLQKRAMGGFEAVKQPVCRKVDEK